MGIYGKIVTFEVSALPNATPTTISHIVFWAQFPIRILQFIELEAYDGRTEHSQLQAHELAKVIYPEIAAAGLK